MTTMTRFTLALTVLLVAGCGLSAPNLSAASSSSLTNETEASCIAGLKDQLATGQLSHGAYEKKLLTDCGVPPTKAGDQGAADAGVPDWFACVEALSQKLDRGGITKDEYEKQVVACYPAQSTTPDPVVECIAALKEKLAAGDITEPQYKALLAACE